MLMRDISNSIEEINNTVVYLQKKEPEKAVEIRKTISSITTTIARKVQLE